MSSSKNRANIEVRSASDNPEVRSIGEVRSIDENGQFEGYIVTWDHVDDYNTLFKRGAFKKTIQERGGKIKVLYDHEHLIGSSTEIREDDTGVFVRGKLNLAVEKAKDVYEFMKDGTIDGLSFGFRTIKDKWENGVRNITEVKIFEYGPVMFPASDEAVITSVRSTNFDDSLTNRDLDAKKYVILDALHTTLSDIWWDSNTNKDNIVGLMDEAISKFHASYLEFVNQFILHYWTDESDDRVSVRKRPAINELSNALNKHLAESGKSIEEVATETRLTVMELMELRKGRLIENREYLNDLSEEVVASHREQRNKAVETLCTELRGKLTESEKARVLALLTPVEVRQSKPDDTSDLLNLFNQIKSDLESKNE
jgi:HK97 family phage prohead protease